MYEDRFRGKAGEEYALFRLACPHFDELEQTISRAIHENFKDKPLDEIRTLELGCGPGYTTSFILDADRRTKVTAVDNERIMISQAQKNLQEFTEKERVVLVEQDALEFLKWQQSSSFDVFASGFTLHNFLEEFRNEVIREIYRVLKPEGLFINADKYALDNTLTHKETLAWQLGEFSRKYTEIDRPDLADIRIRHYLEDNQDTVIMKEWASLSFMQDIGFRNMEILFRKQMEAVLSAMK